LVHIKEIIECVNKVVGDLQEKFHWALANPAQSADF
jgi:hypothetical protein